MEVPLAAPESMAKAPRSSAYQVAADTVRLPRRVPDWHELGACRGFPELQNAWHDSKRGSAQHLAARTICAGCPVRLACALDALKRGEAWGIWGGLDRQDRKALAIEYGFPLPGDPPPHGTNSRRVKWGCPCAECKAAHALYEAQRRERASRRRSPAASCEPAPPRRAPRRAVRLNLAAYHRRYRCRAGRSR
ncbi:WhiB family transcriptional regulator [Actinosynnema sp. CA-248983]